MSTINAKLVMQLREKTGAGIMDCKEALTDCNGDMDAAVDFLRKTVLYSYGRKTRRAGRSEL